MNDNLTISEVEDKIKDIELKYGTDAFSPYSFEKR